MRVSMNLFACFLSRSLGNHGGAWCRRGSRYLVCWAIEYGPLVAEEAQRRKQQTASLWRMYETYTMIKGRWMHQYSVVDKHDQTLDFILSKQRDEAAAEAFFKQAIGNNDIPENVVID